MTAGCGCCFNPKMPYAEEGSEKKKKKFWDIFRRRRKGSESSSDDDESLKKRGFLGRKKKDRGSKDVTNSFYINPVIRTENLKNSVESVKSNNSSELSGRRRIKAKVEASRELLAQESSSDEGSYTSYTSSLHSAGSFPRRSRAARTERHNRRLSRDVDSKVNKWTANIVYQESKDYDTKFRAKARSATPSPAQSPQVKRAASQGRATFKSTSTDNINGKRAPPTPPPRREPRPQSLADPPRYYPPVYTAPSHLIQARLRQSSQKSVSEQYLARLRMETARSVSPRPVRTESTSSVSSESFGKKEDLRPLSIVVEKSEVSDMDARKPPHGPVQVDRRTPRRSSSVSSDVIEARKHSSNLEEALNELEAIYQKLANDEKSYDSSINGEALPTDDMAYRRLNKREPSCQDVREIMGQAGSYLLVSPTLSPPSIIGYIPPHGEPDVTYDDVVFRSVQHSNNTLKCLDPQPPFGIPLGPISPASNSDYLHAKPIPITSGSIPDLVLDDLAFRNLRKDHSKKKAVRSMSANLSGLINRNYINNNNLNSINNNLEEKSHSYSDIPEEMRLAQRVLDMRKNRKSPPKKSENGEARQRFFSDKTETECALLEQLAAETKATSDQIDRELRELSGTDYTKSMTDILQEMTKNLNFDFDCQTCTKEKTKESKYQPIYPGYRERKLTRPGSIGPPRPKNPFKEEPWGRKRDPPVEPNGDRDSLEDDVFYDERECEGTSGADEACREIKKAASGLRRLEKAEEECTVACERVNMVVTATHNMKDTREERMARYKEERRRALAAQFGPREPVAAVSPRSTRASRLRTLANTDNHCTKSPGPKEEDESSIGDNCAKKEKDKSAKRKSYLNRSHTSEPVPPSAGDTGARRRSGLISSNITGICLSAPKKPTTNLNCSPIPKSSQLVRNQLISNQKNERGSTPESDASSSSSRFGKKSGATPSPVNLSPSHKNVRSRTNNGAVVRSNSGSPAKAPHSILKKPSIEEQTSPLHLVTLPVSILKRKTSQDETVARCASPVRFSPSVVEKKGRGILKKHRSLDEPQVEIHSLQEGIDEDKRNGRNGDRRRCSLEEVSRRSPEPQGILKRKASREETESNPDPPQSILKRRSSPLVSTESLSPEPILKKKDEPPVEPRPILKKKSSSEEEEHAVRPILKDSPARRTAAEIRPILKQTDESQIPSVLLRPRARRSYPGENRLSLDAGLLRRLDEPRTGRPLSVAERVQTMETAFNSLDGTVNAKPPSPTLRMDEEECSRGLERSGSVSERASIFAELEQKEKQAAEAAKARRISKGLRNRSKTDRFNTQPVTVIEVEQAKRNNDPNCDEPSKLTLAERVALFTQREESQKKAPAPPPPRRISQAPLLVEGLMKNLAEKSGARAPLIVKRLSTSSTSSESENEQDDRLSPNREIDKEMGEVRTLRRCATQPISARDETDDNKPLTIAERLAALKKNGHSNWMKRIARTSPEEELLSTKPPLSGGSRFSEKLGQLEVAAEGWKARVTTPDSHQFSVAGKMGPVSTPQPALGGANRTPAPQVFTQSPASMSTPSVPDSLAALMKRSISVPEGKENEPAGDAPVVQVPEPYDEDFSSFFLSPDLDRLASSGDVDLVDLEHISSTSHLSVVKRNVRITRKHRSTNPLKALAQRSDLRTEYIEVKSGVADREIRRMNIEKLSKNSNLAVEALAGLASKEDIGGVFLKKADTPSALTAQWTHPMLLRVKGRRHPITSVVKPVYTSVNQGDSFILVTKDKVFHWIGEYCSLTEKSRGSDIAQDIAQRKDLGCTGASNVITLESTGNSERHKEFWRLLALPDLLMSSYKGEGAGHPEEDSVYEVAMSETYMVYRLSGEKLVPVEQYWGRIPKVAILNPSQVLVFDFRSEVYIWSGKNADMAEKRIGTKLAHELFKGGYNSCWYPTGISWLDEEMSKKERPDWSILRRITQHMEPVIFREKFLDWPDFSKIIQAKQIKADNDSKSDGSLEIRPCDIKDMIDWEPPEPDLILEGTHLGRGKSYYDEETRRLFEVKTLTVDIWHIHDYSRTPLDRLSYGHFHRGDSYIIRWNYSVTVTGRELSGEPSKHGSTGRERIAYITWHGSDSPSLEQGAAALHTVDLDSEAATQLVVSCGREPSVFLSLLSSPIVVHFNSRASLSKDQDIASTRLYIVTGEDEDETRLDEVEVSEKSLRSSASLWLVQPAQGTSYLWYGSCCTFKSQAAKAVKRIASSPPPELGTSISNIKVNEIEEGEEPDPFLGGSGNIRRRSYNSQLSSSSPTTERQARLYHLTSLTGELTATGVPSLRTRSNKTVAAFPYLQDDLYSASQPAVFILESSSRVWVWTGWSPADADERGSHMVRHQAEKKAAHTVALGFARAVNLNPADVVTVVAGLEPPAFTSLFPTWSVNEEARAASLEDGWSDGEMRNTQEELAALMRESYPLHTLTSTPLPAGIDPTRLELYLDSTNFKNVFGMEKEEFSELPAWKQVKLKKAVNLF